MRWRPNGPVPWWRSASVSATRAPLWIAKDLGLFEKYGLDGNLVYIASGVTSVNALLGGQTEEQVLAIGARKHEHQPGTTFRVFLDPAGHPQRIPGNTTLANVVCVIPKTPPAALGKTEENA